MPLPKRLVEPVHVSRGTVPENFPLPSELEASTNGTLANTVRQLSSLSRHAEDLFGELARDAHQLYQRSNSLQERIDRLAIKVTQLDSTVEEVSLQDIHMRKAFKSSLVFDQQIFSRDTMPTAMLETYKSCDRPPPLDKLNPYRDDGKDGLKYYTDPNYFFELWREEMVKDTERAMQTKKPHRPRNAQTTSGDGGGGRHKKRVRQPHNTRERFRQIAVCHGEYIMPQQLRAATGNASQQQYNNAGTIQNGNVAADEYQHQLMQQQHAQRPNSIEIHRPYSNQQAEEMIDGIGMNHNQHSPIMMMDEGDYNPYQYSNANATGGPLSNDSVYNQQQQQQQGAGTPTRRVRPTQPPPAPPSNPTSPMSQLSTPTRRTAASAGVAAAAAAAARDNLPPPPPPPESGQGTTCGGTVSPPIAGSSMLSRQALTPEPSVDMLPPPPPVPVAPMPPPPPPMPLAMPSAMAHQDGTGASSASPALMGSGAVVIKAASPPRGDRPPAHVDPRNDLLKAIRDGIKLRKVEKIEQKEVERGNGLHDVASILARRVAVEFSESDSGSAESDCESEGGWGENETSA